MESNSSKSIFDDKTIFGISSEDINIVTLESNGDTENFDLYFQETPADLKPAYLIVRYIGNGLFQEYYSKTFIQHNPVFDERRLQFDNQLAEFIDDYDRTYMAPLSVSRLRPIDLNFSFNFNNENDELSDVVNSLKIMSAKYREKLTADFEKYYKRDFNQGLAQNVVYDFQKELSKPLSH